jgi:hypothetical protein
MTVGESSEFTNAAGAGFGLIGLAPGFARIWRMSELGFRREEPVERSRSESGSGVVWCE